MPSAHYAKEIIETANFHVAATHKDDDVTLVTIGDPVKRLREDPVRMLRAVRLLVELPREGQSQDRTQESLIAL